MSQDIKKLKKMNRKLDRMKTTSKEKWLSMHCPNADREYLERENSRRYIYCHKFKSKCKPSDECINLYYKPTHPFKTKDDLKLISYDTYSQGMNTQFNNGIETAFTSFAERVDFYKKYGIGEVADPWNTLRREETELFLLFCDYIHKKHGELTYSSEVWVNHYREWLYYVCFGDIQ
jgi:hypothetical protein